MNLNLTEEIVMALFLLIIYSDFNISNYFISDNHSKENKETLEDIIFDRTNSDAHIHRADDLL